MKINKEINPKYLQHSREYINKAYVFKIMHGERKNLISKSILILLIDKEINVDNDKISCYFIFTFKLSSKIYLNVF